jgi:hypothetical protein
MHRFPRLRRVARFWWIPVSLLLLILLVPLLWITVVCEPFGDLPEATMAEVDTTAWETTKNLTGYQRAEEQTYLTFPEWYIVYSAEEYAAFIQEKPPSGFPYFRSVGQYWSSYNEVCAITKDKYAFNSTYHMTLYVIGISFTVENIAKGLYENTIGRVTEWVSSPELTEEDALARGVATEYGKFLHTIPWFEFPFSDKLNELWRTTGAWGRNPLRKWERKFVLSLEYGGKALYGGLIKQGAQVAYGPEMLEVFAVASEVNDETLKGIPEVRVAEQLDEEATLIGLPRYEGFTQTVPKLAKQGVRFIEIAGNQQIMVSALAPKEWTYHLQEGEVLFSMDVLTQPHLKRMTLNLPVKSLHTILAALESDGVVLEHLYDY